MSPETRAVTSDRLDEDAEERAAWALQRLYLVYRENMMRALAERRWKERE